MPICGDDQCERCGGVRVARSNLCPHCLVKRLDAVEAENLIKRQVIEALKREIKESNGRLHDALAYGFKKNQENEHLRRKNAELWDQVNRRVKNEKDRKAEDTEKGEKWYPCEVR